MWVHDSEACKFNISTSYRSNSSFFYVATYNFLYSNIQKHLNFKELAPKSLLQQKWLLVDIPIYRNGQHGGYSAWFVHLFTKNLLFSGQQTAFSLKCSIWLNKLIYHNEEIVLHIYFKSTERQICSTTTCSE